MNSLIEQLPKIVARGKKEAQRILDGLSSKNRITLQTNELVLPTKAKGVPKINGKRKVCVKAVDVFGFESAVIQEVK